MIFLTVGTQFPFDRLVRSVDQAIAAGYIYEQVYAQIGNSSYKPKNFDSVKSLDKDLFDDYVSQCSTMISHAGMGAITTALKHDKPLLVMPRLRCYGEVVNDHQLALARRFQRLGHLLVAYTPDEIPYSLIQLNEFTPAKRSCSDRTVAQRIEQFLAESFKDNQRDSYGNIRNTIANQQDKKTSAAPAQHGPDRTDKDTGCGSTGTPG